MRVPALLVVSIFALGVFGWSSPVQAAGNIAKGQEVVDSAFDLYWAMNREIRVIQKRRHLKESRIEGNVFSGVIPNDDFWLYFPIGVSGTYFLTETVGVEFQAAYVQASESGLKDFITTESLKVELPQSLLWHSGVSGVWSPFYGKIGFLASKLIHYDFSMLFGVGAIGTKIYDDNNIETHKKTDIAGNLGAGFRFWLAEDVAVKLEYRHYFYPSEIGGVSFPVEFLVGGSYFFGGVQ